MYTLPNKDVLPSFLPARGVAKNSLYHFVTESQRRLVNLYNQWRHSTDLSVVFHVLVFTKSYTTAVLRKDTRVTMLSDGQGLTAMTCINVD